MPRQDERTFVVTGASSGIGLVTARALGAACAQVVLAVRAVGASQLAAVKGQPIVTDVMSIGPELGTPPPAGCEPSSPFLAASVRSLSPAGSTLPNTL